VSKRFYESYVTRCSDSFAEARLRKVLRRVPKEARRVLDIGCGLGRNLRLLRQHVPAAHLVGWISLNTQSPKLEN